MLVLISYDVATPNAAGRKRLRRVARACLDYGQRVQDSVFECLLDAEQWRRLRTRLLHEIDPVQDSLRFYLLSGDWRRRVEHHGAHPVVDLEGPLIV